jgi:hypothetical protein
MADLTLTCRDVVVRNPSRLVTIVNVLILVSLVAALGAAASVLLTIAQAVPTVSVGSISSESNSGGAIQIQVPITLSDKGPLSLSDINVQTTVTDSSNDKLLAGTVGPLTVAAGATSSLNVQLILDTKTLPAAVLQRLATTSENLTVSAVVSTSLPPFLKASASVSAPLAWGAPVSNLRIGTPAFGFVNATAISATVPVSFQNRNSLLTISGTGNIAVFDGNGTQVGGGTLQVDVPPKSSFNQSAALVVGLPSSQMQSLLFTDQNLSYKAVMTFQSGGQNVFSETLPISYSWKAPLSGLMTGDPSVSPFNSTAVQVTVPVSFTNGNGFLDLATNLKVAILNQTTGVQVGSGSLPISAPPDKSFSGNLTATVKFDASTIASLAFNETTLNYEAMISGTYSGAAFSFDKALQVNWGAPLANFTIGAVSGSSFTSSGIQITVPVSFENHSPWLDINSPVTVTVTNATSGVLLGSTTIQVSAPAGSNFSQQVALTISPPQSMLNSLIFNDRTLAFNLNVTGQSAGFAFTSQKSLTYAWGAPLDSFAVGSPTVSAFNSTDFRVSLPISFADHSEFLNVSTTLSALLLNASSGATAGGGALAVSASPNGQFASTLQIYAKIPTQSLGTMLFNDTTLNYSALLSSSVGSLTATTSKTLSVAWGAPVQGLSIGSFVIAAYNSTYARFSAPISFTDNSTFLGITGTITGNLIGSSGQPIGSITPLPFAVNPGQQFSATLSGFVKLASISQTPFVLNLTVQTPYGSVSKQVVTTA